MEFFRDLYLNIVHRLPYGTSPYVQVGVFSLVFVALVLGVFRIVASLFATPITLILLLVVGSVLGYFIQKSQID